MKSFLYSLRADEADTLSSLMILRSSTLFLCRAKNIRICAILWALKSACGAVKLITSKDAIFQFGNRVELDDSAKAPFTRNPIRLPIRVNSMRSHLSFPIRIIYPSLSGECLSAFESGEQIYSVNYSPSRDTCEQPVQIG